MRGVDNLGDVPVIVPFEYRHLEAAAALEQDSFTVPWTLRMLESELASEYGAYIAAELDGRLAGYGGIQAIVDVAHITTIAVAPELRRRGIGALMLARLIKEAERRQMDEVTLEVRPSNTAAISLYDRFGFKLAGRRKRYYSRPVEDALIMTMTLRDGYKY